MGVGGFGMPAYGGMPLSGPGMPLSGPGMYPPVGGYGPSYGPGYYGPVY